jgi:hypothetical protein
MEDLSLPQQEILAVNFSDTVMLSKDPPKEEDDAHELDMISNRFDPCSEERRWRQSRQRF